MEARRPHSLWRVTMLAYATVRRAVAPVLTLAQWQTLCDTLIPRLREGPRRRVSQAARALLGEYPQLLLQLSEVS